MISPTTVSIFDCRLSMEGCVFFMTRSAIGDQQSAISQVVG